MALDAQKRPCFASDRRNRLSHNCTPACIAGQAVSPVNPVTLSQARDPGNRAASESRKPSFRPPLERSGDPQISPTRQKVFGVLFKGGTIAPAQSVVNKFKQRIHCLLNPREARSLLETLTGLKNTINGWGQCYRKFDVGRLYLDLDAYIRKEVSEFIHHNEFLLQRNTASRKQMRLLGIPERKGQL